MKTDSQPPQDVIAELDCSHPVDASDGDRSRLPAFFALAFAWSWTCWLLAPAIKARSALAAGVLSGLGGFGPGVAAVAMVGYGGGRAALRAWLGRCLHWWAWVVPGLLVAGSARQFALVLGLLVLLAIGLLAWPNRRAWAARPSDSKD